MASFSVQKICEEVLGKYFDDVTVIMLSEEEADIFTYDFSGKSELHMYLGGSGAERIKDVNSSVKVPIFLATIEMGKTLLADINYFEDSDEAEMSALAIISDDGNDRAKFGYCFFN